MELRVDSYDHNHTHVPHYRDCVDGQEVQEEGCLEVWVFRDTQEDEGDSNTLISLFHHYVSWWR